MPFGSGISFGPDDPDLNFLQSAAKPIENPEEKLEGWDRLWVDLYLKVGLFCKISPNEFLDTPKWFVDAISDEIDRRFRSNSPGNKEVEPINYEHAALILALAALFAGGDKKK